MCRFFEVLRSGYYDYVKRIELPSRDFLLAEKIRECQEHCIFRLFVIYTTIASLLTRRVQSRTLFSFYLRSEQPRKRRRSPQSWNSTVTKAFSTHRKHIIA